MALLCVSNAQEQVGFASVRPLAHEGMMTQGNVAFSHDSLVASHRSIPLGKIVRVTNLNNLKSVVLKINDRGPYVHKRILDLSQRAAANIGIRQDDVVQVKVEILDDKTGIISDDYPMPEKLIYSESAETANAAAVEPNETLEAEVTQNIKQDDVPNEVVNSPVETSAPIIVKEIPEKETVVENQEGDNPEVLATSVKEVDENKSETSKAAPQTAPITTDAANLAVPKTEVSQDRPTNSQVADEITTQTKVVETPAQETIQKVTEVTAEETAIETPKVEQEVLTEVKSSNEESLTNKPQTDSSIENLSPKAEEKAEEEIKTIELTAETIPSPEEVPAKTNEGKTEAPVVESVTLQPTKETENIEQVIENPTESDLESAEHDIKKASEENETALNESDNQKVKQSKNKKGLFTIQVGTFNNSDDAYAYAEEMLEKYKIYNLKVQNDLNAKSSEFKVVVGRFTELQYAQTYKDQLVNNIDIFDENSVLILDYTPENTGKDSNENEPENTSEEIVTKSLEDTPEETKTATSEVDSQNEAKTDEDEEEIIAYFTIQVGRFDNIDEANAYSKELFEKHKIFNLKVQPHEKENLTEYKVVVGRFTKREYAQVYKEQLDEKIENTIIIPLEN